MPDDQRQVSPADSNRQTAKPPPRPRPQPRSVHGLNFDAPEPPYDEELGW
jgi:hypothetical protein